MERPTRAGRNTSSQRVGDEDGLFPTAKVRIDPLIIQASSDDIAPIDYPSRSDILHNILYRDTRQDRGICIPPFPATVKFSSVLPHPSWTSSSVYGTINDQLFFWISTAKATARVHSNVRQGAFGRFLNDSGRVYAIGSIPTVKIGTLKAGRADVGHTGRGCLFSAKVARRITTRGATG